MPRNSVKIELFIIGYGLSKFTGSERGKNEIIKRMGYASRNAFFNELLSNGVITSKGSLSNVQDGFDAHFPNGKRGWLDRNHMVQFGNMKNRIDPILGSYDIDEYATLIKNICVYLSNPTALEAGIKQQIDSIVDAVTNGTTAPRQPDIPLPSPTLPDSSIPETTKHLQAQWLLIKIGRLIGCDIFIARNDSSRNYNGESFSDLCVTDIPRVGMEDKVYRRAQLIDVIWIHDRRVVRAFEVECTTSIYSGILRMSDLMYSMPYSHIKCCIVAPTDRVDKVKDEITRPTFYNDHISEKFQYTSIEELQDCYDRIKDFEPGSLNLSIINRYLHYARAE